MNINQNKLSDFDRQCITLTEMDPDGWVLGPTAMSHSLVGAFRMRRWLPLMETATNYSGTPAFRELSLRGGYLLYKAQRRLLGRVVDCQQASALASTPVTPSVGGIFTPYAKPWENLWAKQALDHLHSGSVISQIATPPLPIPNQSTACEIRLRQQEAAQKIQQSLVNTAGMP